MAECTRNRLRVYCKSEKAEEYPKVFEEAGLTATVIGKLIGSRLDMYDKTGRVTVFDFSRKRYRY